MRTWAKVTLGGVVVIAVALAVLGGMGAYFVLRHMETKTSAEADALRAIEVVKGRFGPRPPLIEIVDPLRTDIRINRPADASPTPVRTMHIINWNSDTRELMRTEFPVWLTRFSSVNVLSQLGVAPEKFRLTVNDIQRYGPGIVLDYGPRGTSRVLVWVD